MSALDAWSTEPKKNEPVKQEQTQEVKETTEAPLEQVETAAPEINIEQESLKFLSQKFNKEFNSWDDVKFDEPKQDETSELAKTIDKFVKETGRGVNEWLYIQSIEQNIDKVGADALIKEKMKIANPELTDEDVDALFEDRYMLKEINEEEMEESEIKAAKKHNKVVELKMKEEAKEAKKYIQEQIEKFRAPKETANKEVDVDFDEKEFLSQYEQSLNETKEIQYDLGDGVNFNFVVDDEVKSIVKGMTPQKYLESLIGEDGKIDAETFSMHMILINTIEKQIAYASSQKSAAKVEEVVKEMKNVNLETQTRIEAPKTSKSVFDAFW